jgi:hypothetical protein
MAIWNILWPFGTFYVQLAIYRQFGTFSPVLVYCVKQNLATLILSTNSQQCCYDFPTSLYLGVIRNNGLILRISFGSDLKLKKLVYVFLVPAVPRNRSNIVK